MLFEILRVHYLRVTLRGNKKYRLTGNCSSLTKIFTAYTFSYALHYTQTDIIWLWTYKYLK